MPETTISFAFDSDLSRLEVVARSALFRGYGKATLYVRDLPAVERFLAGLAVYPLEPCSLSLVGFGRVRLTAYQTHPLSHPYLQAELAEDDNPNADSAIISVRMDYPNLGRFRSQLKQMFEGQLEEFTVCDRAG